MEQTAGAAQPEYSHELSGADAPSASSTRRARVPVDEPVARDPRQSPRRAPSHSKRTISLFTKPSSCGSPTIPAHARAGGDFAEVLTTAADEWAVLRTRIVRDVGQ